MEQSKEQTLVNDLVKIMIRNGVNHIDPKRIAGPLQMSEEEVAIILMDSADELGLYYYYNMHCPDCGNIMFTNKHRPGATYNTPLVCGKCGSCKSADASWVYGVYGEPEMCKVVDQILAHLNKSERPPKIYPMDIAKLLNHSYESVVDVLESIECLNAGYELICPYCGMIQDVFPSLPSHVSGSAVFPCKLCDEDLAPIYDEDSHLVYWEDGLSWSESMSVGKAITPEMIYSRCKLEQRR